MAIEIESKSTAAPRRSIGDQFASLSHNKAIGTKERHVFTEQLALLLSTGTNLHAALLALRQQAEGSKMQALVDQLIDDVGQGRQFSAALARHPAVFSSTYINLIAASEGGGYMHQVLEQLLEMEEKREQLHRTLVSALSYPAFLLVFALAVVVFVLVIVFPKFVDLFAGIRDQLPVTTVFLMGASEVFRHQWYVVLGGLAACYVGLRYWASSTAGRARIDWAQLHLPLARGIFTRLYLLQSLRVLSLSLGNGVGILEALHASRDVVRNRLFQRLIDRVEERVQGGEGIAAGFAGTSFVPPVVEQMIKTGEETSNLPKVMGRLADHYERELTVRLETVSRMAEPIMLLVMGVVVGLLVSSLILPIFKLSRAVG